MFDLLYAKDAFRNTMEAQIRVLAALERPDIPADEATRLDGIQQSLGATGGVIGRLILESDPDFLDEYLRHGFDPPESPVYNRYAIWIANGLHLQTVATSHEAALNWADDQLDRMHGKSATFEVAGVAVTWECYIKDSLPFGGLPVDCVEVLEENVGKGG